MNDILDLSRIEAGKLSIDSATFSAKALTEEVLRLFEESARQKHIRLEAQLLDSCDAPVRGDPLRIRQMLTNLVGNAIKFTREGVVTISVRREAVHDPTPSPLLRFEVRDTGVGIDQKTLARLFRPFSQADDSTTRHYSGTGLGLAIVKELATAMGGAVGVESAVGRGSTFWFTVRVEVVSTPAEPSVEPSLSEAGVPSPIAAGEHRVLVVEDQPVNRLVVESMLTYLGFNHESVENGEQAIAALDRTRCDLVLMDQHMPIMDGLEATRVIRARERAAGRARVPIIALSASVFEEDKRKAIASGMDNFLTKPIAIEDLSQALHLTLRARQGASRSTE